MQSPSLLYRQCLQISYFLEQPASIVLRTITARQHVLCSQKLQKS
jgi:hypothetical protein